MKHDNDCIAGTLDKLERLGVKPTIEVIILLEKLWNYAEDWGRKQPTKIK